MNYRFFNNSNIKRYIFENLWHKIITLNYRFFNNSNIKRYIFENLWYEL